jgi:uncharacterized membrane protein
MKPVRVRIEIEAPADVVWPLLADFVHWPEWGPSVRAVDVEASTVAAGVTGRVRTAIGVWLPFEIGAVEPGRSWQWSVAGIDATGHGLEPLSESRCAVEFSVPRLFAPYRWVLERGLRRIKALAEQVAAAE